MYKIQNTLRGKEPLEEIQEAANEFIKKILKKYKSLKWTYPTWSLDKESWENEPTPRPPFYARLNGFVVKVDHSWGGLCNY